MTFEQLFWIHTVGLALLLIISTLTMRFLHRKRFSVSFGSAYLAFILIVSCFYFPGEKDAQDELYWLIPGTLTLPASLLLMPIVRFIGTEGMAILLAVFGTIQYLGIGLLIDWIIEKKRSHRDSLNK